MACGTVVGQALEFGITDDEASLVTQSISVTHKKDKKEARDKCGIIVAVAYYNPTSEITIEGLGTSALLVGAALSLTGDYSLAGATYIDEVSVDYGNEEFVKSSIKATSYGGIAAGS